MQYLGGKCQIAKNITKAILENTTSRSRFIEPFIGGAAITSRIAKYFDVVFASDIHEDLILMWQSLSKGWEPPDSVSEDEYKELRNSQPSALRGFTGFGCSFGGKWFGGYARNSIGFDYCGATKRVVLRDIGKMNNVYFTHCKYSEVSPTKGDVVYCDPPYANTTGYKDKFNSEEFWATVNDWSDKGVNVFVSEYTAPSNWIPVWEKSYNRKLRGDLKTVDRVVDKLWIKK